MAVESPESVIWQLVKIGAYEQALPWFEKQCLSGDARGPDFYNLGLVRLLLRNYHSALSCFVRSAEVTEPRFRTAGAYIRQGLCHWFIGAPERTVDLLRHAMRAPYTDAAGGVLPPALLLYVAERLDSSALRTEAIGLLRKHARRKLKGWPGPIVPFLLGKIDDASLDRKAQQYPNLHVRWQCQADFFVALRALRAGDRAKSMRRMKAAAYDCGAYLEDEYFLARWELEHGFPFPRSADHLSEDEKGSARVQVGDISGAHAEGAITTLND